VTLNAAAMQYAATNLQTILGYGQLHAGPAGDGTANRTTAARQPILWSNPDSAGNFGLVYLVIFGGGSAGGPVYSLTLWDTATTGGTCYAELPLTGDTKFNASGVFQVTACDFTALVGAGS
jgi:hypothetical protein